LYERKAPKDPYDSAAMSIFNMIHHNQQCHTGFYAGYADDDVLTMTAGRCADICALDAKCLYFAYKPFETCSRFDESANGCARKSGDGFTLYEKIVN